MKDSRARQNGGDPVLTLPNQMQYVRIFVLPSGYSSTAPLVAFRLNAAVCAHLMQDLSHGKTLKTSPNWCFNIWLASIGHCRSMSFSLMKY